MDVVKFSAQAPGQLTITLFLHGFPGVRSKQNREIAEEVSRLTHRRSDVALYVGLGQVPGVFSFSQTIREVDDYVQGLFETNPSLQLDLVGHSFGGLLAIRLAGRLKSRIRKMVLLSPLVNIRIGEAVRLWLVACADSRPEINLGSIDELYADYSRMANEISVEKLVSSISDSVETLILHADQDDLIPSSDSKKVAGIFVRPAKYELVANDHSFLSNRRELAARIANFLGCADQR